MPWDQEAMKDVAGCEKLRGVVNILWSLDIRMGKPNSLELLISEFIANKSQPSELKYLSS